MIYSSYASQTPVGPGVLTSSSQQMTTLHDLSSCLYSASAHHLLVWESDIEEKPAARGRGKCKPCAEIQLDLEKESEISIDRMTTMCAK